jgi:glycosyltransferase involved in cell wall biosynthesis
MSHNQELNLTEDFRISVIIPSYNAGSYLAEAIASVVAQSIKPFEIILIDDGSTDGSALLAAQSFPFLRYYRQENSGSGSARNKGIEVACGNYFAFLDADDLWLENKLALQVRTFVENPGLEAVFGHVKQFCSPELGPELKKRLFCPEEPMLGHLPAMMLIRRESFYRVGLFETHWRVGQDVSWILRSRGLGLKTIMLPDAIYMRRLHNNNKGITQRQFINDRVKIIKAHLDAKRNPQH